MYASASIMVGYQVLRDFEHVIIVGVQEMELIIFEASTKFRFSHMIILRLNIAYTVKHQMSNIGVAGKRPGKTELSMTDEKP